MDKRNSELFQRLKIKRTVVNHFNVLSKQYEDQLRKRLEEVTRILTPAYIVQSQFNGACDLLINSLQSFINSHSVKMHSSVNSRLKKNISIVKAFNKSLESKQDEKKTDPYKVKLLEEVKYLRFNVETLEGIHEQMQQEEEFYILNCIKIQEISRDKRKELKDVYRQNIQLAHSIETLDRLKRSHTLNSFSKRSVHIKTQTTPENLQSIQKNTHKISDHSFSHQKMKRFRRDCNSLTSIGLKYVEPPEIQVIFKQGITILMKSLGPMKKTLIKKQTCKSYGHKTELIPSWELFKNWPVKKVITLLSLYRAVQKELFTQTFMYKIETEISNDLNMNFSLTQSRNSTVYNFPTIL